MKLPEKYIPPQYDKTKYAAMTWQICSDSLTSSENEVVENGVIGTAKLAVTATPLLHCNLALILIHRSAAHLQLEHSGSQPPELSPPNTALRLLCELNQTTELGPITN